MDWLRKQIEDKIREIYIFSFENDYDRGLYNAYNIILSLIDQMICDNCIYDNPAGLPIDCGFKLELKKDEKGCFKFVKKD